LEEAGIDLLVRETQDYHYGTLLRVQYTFPAAFLLPLERFSWKFTHLIFDTCYKCYKFGYDRSI